jgi:hypothetical protein
MSGSKSSLADAPAPEVPLDMAVHAQAPVDDLMRDERTARGRWMMAMVVFLCALPVIASYFTFYVIQPRSQGYGELITPTVKLPADLPLRTLDGQRILAASLKQQWLLVVVDGGSCVGECEEHLYMQRQLREMLGKERDRVDKLWLVVDDAPIKPALQTSLSQSPAMTVLRTDRDALAKWLQPAQGQSLTGHLYIVDPMGRWMWRSPLRPDPQRVRSDLQKLLRASNSWDLPGRPQ